MADPSLSKFLNFYNSYSNQAMPKEIYDVFGGDSLLEAIKKFDPSANFSMEKMAGEGNENFGYKLNFDLNKMPIPSGFKDWGDGISARPSDWNDGMINPNMYKNDPNYGKITHVSNTKKQKDPTWTKYAPLAVGIGGPLAAGWLAGMGIGAPGLTGAVTGSGMGGASAPKWVAQLAKGIPQQLAKSGGKFNPLGMAAGIGMGMIPGMKNINSMLQMYQMSQMMKKYKGGS